MRWWLAVIAAAVLTLGVRACYNAGVRAMEADPPRVVVEKAAGMESHSYSCGKNCVTTSNSQVYWLVGPNGETCKVSARDWVQTPKGARFKCPQLFGWSE